MRAVAQGDLQRAEDTFTDDATEPPTVALLLLTTLTEAAWDTTKASRDLWKLADRTY